MQGFKPLGVQVGGSWECKRGVRSAGGSRESGVGGASGRGVGNRGCRQKAIPTEGKRELGQQAGGSLDSGLKAGES